MIDYRETMYKRIDKRYFGCNIKSVYLGYD